MPVMRSTISFHPLNWKRVKNKKNRSKTINAALDYYYKAQEFLKKKEEEFILQEFEHFQKNRRKLYL